MFQLDWIKERIRGTGLHSALRSCRARLGNRGALYDIQTGRVLRRILRLDSTCVDVGAHRGEILRQIVRLAPKGAHFAFEPIPEHAEYLSKKYPGVVVHQCALADYAGTSDFHFVTNASAYSGLRRRIYDRRDPEIAIISVDVRTLDESLPSHSHVDFIKIDVEGGEFHVLKGSLETIRRCKPVIIFEAGEKGTGQYGVRPADLFLLLTGTMGYSLTTMDRWLHRRTSYTAAEFENAWTSERDYYFLAEPRS